MRRAIARGRVFPQSYSTDRRYGRISLKAGALYPLMWVNADDQGRLTGDPEEIKYTCCPNIDHITKADIPGILKELQDNKFIILYDTPKSAVIQLLDWWESHNKMQWAYPSDYTPPRGWQDHLRYKRGRDSVITTVNWPEPEGKHRPETDHKSSILERDNYTCQKCGSTDKENLIIHHIIPLQNGGSNDPENLTTLCHKCYSLMHQNNSLAGNQAGALAGNQAGALAGNRSQRERSKERYPENEDKNGIGRGRGKRRAPGVPGGTPGGKSSPSPAALSRQDILDELTKCFQREWGRVPARRPYEVIPRAPDTRESAQLRDLAKELYAAGGCTPQVIRESFRDAAGRPTKMHISYVAAILRQRLGIERNRSP